jgi:hypothetical protein
MQRRLQGPLTAKTGSSPLGSANEINVLEETAGSGERGISNFSPTGARAELAQ